jgi:exonuclease V
MSLDDDDDYGTELEYDADFEQTLQAAESQPFIPARQEPEMRDIEDIAAPTLSPFQEFRKKGFLSVSDLVATAWCEVQYD